MVPQSRSRTCSDNAPVPPAGEDNLAAPPALRPSDVRSLLPGNPGAPEWSIADAEVARRLRDRLDELVSEHAVSPEWLRLGALLDQAATPPDGPEGLVVHPNGSWFRLDGGYRVDCIKRPLLGRLLCRLAAARMDQPGTPVSVEELLAAGWRGERMSLVAGRNRLKQAVAVLRRLGLAKAIRRSRGGYLLSRDVPFAFHEEG